MGKVINSEGQSRIIEEIQEDELTFEQLFLDVGCAEYTDSYRVECIKACGKLGREAWGVINTLQELTKLTNKKLSDAAIEALKCIDPGGSILRKEYSDSIMPKSNDNYSGLRSDTKRFPVQTGSGTVYKTLEVKQIALTEVSGDLLAGAKAHGVCNFCEKMIVVNSSLRKYNDLIAGPDEGGKNRLFCTSCLRNGMYKEQVSRNTLVMSFRGIISYYFYCFNHIPKNSPMFLADIQGMIDNHVRFGLANPLFRYDADTYLWFVDFSKVSKKSISINNILEATQSMLFTFNPYENLRDCGNLKLFNKFKDAILDFHHHRRRPEGQKMLIPTLFGCGIPVDNGNNKAIPVSYLKNFIPANLDNKKK